MIIIFVQILNEFQLLVLIGGFPSPNEFHIVAIYNGISRVGQNQWTLGTQEVHYRTKRPHVKRLRGLDGIEIEKLWGIVWP